MKRFKSMWHEGYYYVLGAGQDPFKRVVAWMLFPMPLFAITVISILFSELEPLEDPRTKEVEPCVKCKHHYMDKMSFRHRCKHPKCVKVSDITGVVMAAFCENHRGPFRDCDNGKLFEPKEGNSE